MTHTIDALNCMRLHVKRVITVSKGIIAMSLSERGISRQGSI